MGGRTYEPLAHRESVDPGLGAGPARSLHAVEGEPAPAAGSLVSGRLRARAAVAAVLLGTLLAATWAFRSARGAGAAGALGERFPADGDGAVLLAAQREHCHTAVPGEPCYKDVSWAITDGIYAHPEWYFGLTNKSNFEAFQAVVYKINSTKCPLPCNYAPLAEKKEEEAKKGLRHSKEEGDKQHRHKSEVEGGKKHLPVTEKHLKKKQRLPATKTTTTTTTPAPTEEPHDVQAEAACHTAVEGDACFKAVRWAMHHGVKDQPEWYEGLDEHSTFEEFQAKLHETPKTQCPKPCACKTTVPGETCYEHVLWVLKEGVKKHPEWYQGLTHASRFEEVQARLYEDTNTTCERPCMPRFFGTPSLFGFSVFQPKGYEPGLMKEQLKKRQGIFSCDEFAVICDTEYSLGQGPYGEVKALVIEHETVGISKDNTAANTLIFIHAWQAIYDDYRFSHHDWTLKVDPDALIVPSRLRTHLEPHTGKQVYVKNCNKYPGSPQWPMMFGSLEAIAQGAIWTYMLHSHKCKNELEWQAWGEDLFLAECLDLLGCESIHDYEIISDKVCMGVDCTDKRAAAFHAFKGTEEWFECWHTIFD